MNKSSLLGFAAIAVLFNFAVFTNAKAPGIFFDGNTLLFVIGGTLAAALIAYPYSTLLRSIDYLTWGLIFKKKKNYLQISQDIAGARNSFLINQNYITNDESHPFLREAVLFLLNKNIDNKAFEEILNNRSEFFKKRYVDDAQVLRSLVKYPIAFGLLAAFVKAASLLWTFEASTQNSLGHDAAMAFVAIFWGVAVSCILFYPLSDSANKAAEEDQEIRNLIIDGMILIREKATDDYFQAYLRGYLNLNERSNFKIFSGKSGFGPYGGITVPKIEIKDDAPAPSYMDSSEPKERVQKQKSKHREVPVKHDEKPFEKLKSYASPQVVKIRPEEPQEVEVDSVLDQGISLDGSEKVLPSADMDDGYEASQVVSEVSEVYEQSEQVEEKIQFTNFGMPKKVRKDKVEQPGRQDEPVKIDADAPTTALETFKFKDLRKQLMTGKKKA